MSAFVHLNVRSTYSLAQSSIHLKDLVKFAKKYCHDGSPSLAINDTNNMFGALEFSLACKDQKVQPIIGCNLWFKHSENYGFLNLIAKNMVGYQNLMKLVSQFYVNPDCKKNVNFAFDSAVDFKLLHKYSEGIICLTGCHNGLLINSLLNNTESHLHNTITDLQKIFSDRLYIEIQRHGLEKEIATEEKLLNTAYDLNIPIVATNNVHFAKREDFDANDVLFCIAKGRYISEDDREKLTPEHYFKSPSEMAEIFHDLPEAIENTKFISQRCSYAPNSSKPILPKYADNEENLLQQKSVEGLLVRLENEVYPFIKICEQSIVYQKYRDRLDYELGVINSMGFAGYFLIVADFIQWAKSANIPVGPGRGSGAGSLVAWSLTITDIDPIKFNLIFERFLNPERVSMPDFDIDFCQERRDEVIKYVQNRYGPDKVAHIITFGKMQARMVLRDVGRVLQIPYGKVDKICKLVPQNPANPVSLEGALAIEPALKQMIAQEEVVQELFKIAQKLEGVYRHASTHAAGVVISDKPLTEIVPLYKDDESLLPATQFNMKYVEMAGLVKFDFLGLKTLTVIEMAACLIRKNHQIKFDIRYIPLDDQKTLALLCRVETVGIFQVEGGGMRDVLRQLQPDRLEDIIALVALYRPGPMDDIPKYLAVKHGTEKVTYLHPMLQSILHNTYGVMVYQEQVMEIAQTIGGYTLGAADLLRRAMGKKIKSEMEGQKNIFIQGAIKNGLSEDLAGQIFEQIAKFAGYGFNKSHSASYALLTYQTAYLKANYPLEFFAATMTYDMHNTEKLGIYIQDLQRAKIKLLPPDINNSFAEFTVESNCIRYGLGAIKNVGIHSIKQIIEERDKNGFFRDIEDFCRRTHPNNLNKRLLESCISAGVFDCLNTNRKQLFDNIETILKYSQSCEQSKISRQKVLFGQGSQNNFAKFPELPKTRDWNYAQKLSYEMDALGFYLSSHPLAIYKNFLENKNIIPSSKILEKFLEDGKVNFFTMAGVIVQKQERLSKSGQKFAFVNFTDEYGSFEVAFFSNTYQQYKEFLQEGKNLIIDINAKKESDQIRLTAQSIHILDTPNMSKKIYFTIHENDDLEKLQKIISQINDGNNEIFFKIPIAQYKSTVFYKLKNKYEWDPFIETEAKKNFTIDLVQD